MLAGDGIFSGIIPARLSYLGTAIGRLLYHNVGLNMGVYLLFGTVSYPSSLSLSPKTSSAS